MYCRKSETLVSGIDAQRRWGGIRGGIVKGGEKGGAGIVALAIFEIEDTLICYR